MKTCPKCNKTNQDEFAFCESCGNSLDRPTSNPTQSNSTQSDPAPVIQTPKKNSTLKKVLLLCIIIGIGYFIISNLVLAFNPTYKLLNGLAGLSKIDKSTVSMTADFGYKGKVSEAKIIEDITIKSNTATDLNNFLAEASLEFLYDNKSVTKVALGANNDDIYIDLLKLYNKKFYQELDSFIPNFQESINDIKIIKKALNDVKLKIDTKKYADIVKEVLDDNLESSFNKITLTLDVETAAELWESILEEAVEDEKLMESVRKNGISLIKKILKDKKLFELLNEDNLEDTLEVLEDKDEFEEIYQKGLKSATGTTGYLRLISNYTESIPKIKITFKFGLFNNISGIDYNLSIVDPFSNQSVKIDIKTDIKKGAKFTKYKKGDAIEIKELIEDEDKTEEIAEEVVGNIIKAVKGNKKLTKEIEDITDYDIDDLEDELMNYLMSDMLY